MLLSLKPQKRGNRDPKSVHTFVFWSSMFVTSKSALYGELLCATGAAMFVTANCWLGWSIALNGILAHAYVEITNSARWLVAYDTACNVCFIVLGLATSTWEPQCWIAFSIMLHGFFMSYTLSKDMPFLSRVVHFAFVQVPAFATVWSWCRCCDPLHTYDVLNE